MAVDTITPQLMAQLQTLRPSSAPSYGTPQAADPVQPVRDVRASDSAVRVEISAEARQAAQAAQAAQVDRAENVGKAADVDSVAAVSPANISGSSVGRVEVPFGQSDTEPVPRPGSLIDIRI